MIERLPVCAHDHPVARTVDFLIGEARRCGVHITDTVRVEGDEFTIRGVANRTMEAVLIIGTVRDCLAAFDRYRGAP